MMNETALLSSLRALAEKTLNDCTHIKALDFEPEPARVLLPSGDEKYYAFWVRDTAMMAESHLIPNADLRRYVAMTAAYGQNGPDTRYLLNGLQVPPYAVTDHINYNGKPVFFPGMYRDGDDQGDGTYGSYPPFCDNYYFITMTGDYIAQSGDKAILDEVFSGMTLRDRLRRAMDGYNLDPETGLCRSERDRFTVNWGFVDSTAQSGQLLFASLLRMNAARHMETLCPGEGYGALAESLRGAILRTFYDEETGWLWSSDDSDRQHDVWGTAYAVYLGVPDEARARRTARTLADAYVSGRTGVDGYIRHIPIGEDWQPGVTAWARCSVPIDWYQNGTFWATPTGWYAYAVSLCDRGLGLSILSDFVSHTKRYADKGAPFEWMQADSKVYSGCLYGTSGVLPYAGLCRILEKSIDAKGDPPMIPLYENHPSLAVCKQQLDAALTLLNDTFAAGKKLLLCGNGGSSADCDHIVGELCKGFLSRRPLSGSACRDFSLALGADDPDLALLCGSLQGGLPAVSLPSQTALVSAFCNDVDASLVYAQLVWAVGKPGDLLWCLSTSGNSKNVVLAAKAARAKGMRVLTMCGEKPCVLDALSDVVIHAPAAETYRIQEYHLPIYHWLCAAVEEKFFGGADR